MQALQVVDNRVFSSAMCASGLRAKVPISLAGVLSASNLVKMEPVQVAELVRFRVTEATAVARYLGVFMVFTNKLFSKRQLRETMRRLMG